MKNIKIMSSVGLVFLLLLSSTVQAQMFQNNNVACEVEALSTQTTLKVLPVNFIRGLRTLITAVLLIVLPKMLIGILQERIIRQYS